VAAAAGRPGRLHSRGARAKEGVVPEGEVQDPVGRGAGVSHFKSAAHVAFTHSRIIIC